MAADLGWHDKVIEALQNSIELLSPGGLTFATGDDEHELAVAPSLLQIEVEEDNMYSHFNFDISGFAKAFDEPPHISWRTYPDSALLFEGTIDGVDGLFHIFGQPFDDAQPVGVVDDDGNVREIQSAGEAKVANDLEDELAKQAQRFRDKFGRDPGPNDPIFFDPDADEPIPADVGKVTAALVAASDRAGVHPAYIHAIEKTGLLVTDTNRHLLDDADLNKWKAAVEDGEEIYGAVKNADTNGLKEKLN